MDRDLILRMLGKKDSVDLYDSIYNLRDMGNELRKIIILNLLNEEELIKYKNEFKNIHNTIKPILDKVKDDNYIKGYTNSKKYLIKYIEDLYKSIDGIINGIERIDIKEIIYHINILMDKVLVY